MDTNYAKGKLKLVLRDIDNYNDGEFWRELSRIAYGSTTGQPNAEELGIQLTDAKEKIHHLKGSLTWITDERDELLALCEDMDDLLDAVAAGTNDSWIYNDIKRFNQSPKQSLLLHDAAVIDSAIEKLKDYISIGGLLSLQNYRDELRQQAKEGVK